MANNTPTPYRAPANYGSNLNYGATDPKKVVQGNRQQIGQQGSSLDQQAQQQAAQAASASGQTQDYLGGIESPLAQGQGGYTAGEQSQIQMSPQQQQQIITGAGISAGAGTAASVGAAQRASNATGGNPLAMAAYRARAAQQEGQQAGDAMTQARIGTQQAGASEAENIGQARIGQQNQALGYYGGLQSQQNQNAQGAYGRQQQTYGTETGGLNQSAQTAEQASQNPTTFDKAVGAVGGALSALGQGDFLTKHTPAVVGEHGPEKVVQLGRANYMDDGGITPSLATAPHSADYTAMMSGAGPQASTTTTNPDGSLTFDSGAPDAAQQPWWAKVKSALATPQPTAPASGGQAQQPWNPVNTYSTLGQGAGKGIAALAGLADGGIATDGDIPASLRDPKPGFGQMPTAPQGANGIFDSPTRVNLNPGEAVVPLSYRAGAKVRPHFAAMPAAKNRHSYGAPRV